MSGLWGSISGWWNPSTPDLSECARKSKNLQSAKDVSIHIIDVPEGVLREVLKKRSVSTSDIPERREFSKNDPLSSSQGKLRSVFSASVLGEENDLRSQEVVSPRDLLKIAGHDHAVKQGRIAQGLKGMDPKSPQYKERLQALTRTEYSGLEQKKYHEMIKEARERSRTIS